MHFYCFTAYYAMLSRNALRCFMSNISHRFFTLPVAALVLILNYTCV